MTVNRLIELLQTVNPGFYVMLAALVAAVARDVVSRALALVGGPALALLVMLFPTAAAIDETRYSFLGLEFALYRTDSLSLIFGFGFVLGAALGGIYSLHRRDRLQDAAGLIYAGSAMGSVFAGDLLSLVIFAEMATLASAVLVFAQRTGPAYRAGMRYLAIQSIAGLALLAGAALFSAGKGTFLLSELGSLRDSVTAGDPAALLILAGIGVKAAFPLVHNWLTDAYPNTTETGAVMMSPFTTTLAVYVLMRLFAGLDMLVWIGAAMTVYPVFFAVMENDLRKVLAYSSNNQIGFMVCAAGIGTPLALNGAAALAVAHIVFKSLLFMAMGAIWMRLGTTKATELGGLHRTMPWTTIACLIGAASISALPFFSGYAAKAMIMADASTSPAVFIAWLMLLFASAGVLEHAGIKIPYFAFFSHDSGKRPDEAPFTMLLAMGLAAALSMSIGLSPRWFYELLPFRDEALMFLNAELFGTAHVIEQLQLLTFAVLAFMLLKWLKLYPPERPGVILDAEWIWRKGMPRLSRALARPIGAPVRGIRSGTRATLRSVMGAARQVFASDGIVARKVPLTATAVWTLAILGLVVAVSIFS